MNLTTKRLIAGSVVAAAILGGSLAVGSAAGASVHARPHAVSASANVSFANWKDNGHGTPSEWLLYPYYTLGFNTQGALHSAITVGIPVNVASVNCPAGPGQCKRYSVTMTAWGSGSTIRYAGSPNDQLPGSLACPSFWVNLSNSSLTETIWTRGLPVNSLSGRVFWNNSRPFSSVPELFFSTPVSRVITGYKFNYAPLPSASDPALIGWTDSSDNNDGSGTNLFTVGQITCA